MASKKKALLIGINDYSPIGPGGSDLNGCVNDVRDMANTLVICGFEPTLIRIMTNARAQKKNILDGLDWLTKGSKSGDSLVFYYSGHGSYVPDLNGDEYDGKDEVICPHDWPNYISDDDFKSIFGKVPTGVNLEVIMDCCHSGTGSRELITNPGLDSQKVLRSRVINPPFDFTFYEDFKVSESKPLKKIFSNSYKNNKKIKRDVVQVNTKTDILWAGCKDNQLSNETDISGNIRGIFTYHFCSVLRATSGNISRIKLDSLVSAAIKRYGFNQTPQLEAANNKLESIIFS